MNRKLEHFLKDIKHYCADDLIEDSTYALERCVKSLKNEYGTNEAALERIFNFILVAFNLDSHLDEEEVRFLNKVFSEYYYDYEWQSIIDRYAYDEYGFVIQFDELDYDVKCDIIFIVICICAVDDRISNDEMRFIKKILKLV